MAILMIKLPTAIQVSLTACVRAHAYTHAWTSVYITSESWLWCCMRTVFKLLMFERLGEGYMGIPGHFFATYCFSNYFKISG